MSEPILVVGSLNMDFVVQVGKLPAPGETVRGSDFVTVPGGKGANQACAAGRIGGRSSMIGRVGGDVFGEQLRASLARAGVDTSSVQATPGVATGVALIFVERGGQNVIVVAGGANELLSVTDVEQALADASGGYLLLQLECRQETVEAAAALARTRGMRVILDPAPARAVPDAFLQSVDILTPNETEALIHLGRPARPVALSEAPEIARALRGRCPGTVILKMGENGAWLDDGHISRHFPTLKVEAVDATAAGDTFNGALAVALAEGKSMPEAIDFANRAAALSVTRLGAQSSIPTRAEVDSTAR
jgi:ribokinase